MKRVECCFEAEVLDAALQSRWPDGADAELVAHAKECEICSEALTVGTTFAEAREDARAGANVPHSGHMWRVAQLRARREAEHAAMAPISVAQVIGFGFAFSLAGACFGATSTWFQWALGCVLSSLSGPNVRALAAMAAEHTMLIATALVIVVVVPAAVYLTSPGD